MGYQVQVGDTVVLMPTDGRSDHWVGVEGVVHAVRGDGTVRLVVTWPGNSGVYLGKTCNVGDAGLRLTRESLFHKPRSKT